MAPVVIPRLAILVVGVIIYNWIVERHIRQKLKVRAERDAGSVGEALRDARSSRVEPRLAQENDDRADFVARELSKPQTALRS